MSFSGPLTISKKGKEEVREVLAQTIHTISEKVASDDDAEELIVCNIDWIGL